jgi:hypothetical protein
LVSLLVNQTAIRLSLQRHRYQYPDDPKDLGTTLSAAQYVEDVEEDPVIIINGLTKGWRYVTI